jgi:hypothetical protein
MLPILNCLRLQVYLMLKGKLKQADNLVAFMEDDMVKSNIGCLPLSPMLSCSEFSLAFDGV